MRRPPCLLPLAAAGTLLSLMLCTAPRAQGDPFDRYATRPDQWRPATPAAPGVDARGDLNLSIPLLTVPGRAGLDYQVDLSYQAGIRYADRGSWVGTGWRFDPGSITRDVFGVLSTSGAPANVDFAALPALQPDAYYVTLPGANATMVRHAGAPGTVRPIRQDSSGFYLTDWRPWRISARTASPLTVAGQQTLFDPPGGPAEARADFRRFVITSEDGTRYVFDLPTLATYYGINANLSGRTSEQYVATWRLVAVLGPDYRGPEIPSGREDGAWIRLTYGDGTTPGAVLSHVAQDPAARPDGADRQPLGQSIVLMEVLTPTHRAVFSTVPRGLENFATWEQQEAVVMHRRLTSVTLYSRSTGETGRVVRRATLEPAAVGFPSQGNGDRRLALARIRFFGRGALADGQPGPEAPGYWFDYYRMEDEGGDINTADDFGYYTTRPRSQGYNGDVDDGKAWSLRSVVYPTGGWDEFEYENDDIQPGNLSYGRYNAATGASNSPFYAVSSILTRQGGTRVVRVRRFDGITRSFGAPVPVVTTYAYGPGRLTAPPPLSWNIQYGSHRLFLPQERGRAAVYYDSVERQGQDGSRVVTRYTTAATHPNVVRPVETVVWDWPHQDGGPGGTTNPAGIRAMAVAQGNQDWAWGHPYEVEYRNPARVTRRVTRTLALTGYEPLAAGPAPTLAVAWATGVNARVEWSYGPRLLQEDERDLSATGIAAGPSRAFVYHDTRGAGWPAGTTGSGLLRSMTDLREDGRRRRTEYVYGYEVYPQLVEVNRLAPVVREDLVELDAAGVPVAWHRSSATRWKSAQGIPPGQTPFSPPTFFLPHEVWAWVAPAPGPTRPDFAQWSGGAPGVQWQRQQSTESYDQHGLPARLLDARAFETQLMRDDAGRVARVVRETGSGTSLAATFGYDPHFGLLAVATDANNGRTTFSFDEQGRLSEVRDRFGAVSATYEYQTPREQDGRMDGVRPDRVSATRWTGVMPDRGVTIEYFDGLGRNIQSQVLDEGGQYIVNDRRYVDPAGASRAEQARVPIRRNSGGAYEAYLVWSGPGAFAGLIEDQPPTTPSVFQNYTETRFVRDGTGRVQGRTFPNQGSAPIQQTFHWYDAEMVGGRPLRLSSVMDESNDRTDTWTDGWGQAIRSRRRITAGVGEPGLYTEFQYDADGNATVVRPPNYFAPPHGSPADWETRSTYDTRGQLTARRTPDAGEELFAYDPAGNLRFRQDASQRAEGQFVAIRHDALGRPTRSGAFPLAAAGAGSFAALDPRASYSASAWENDASRWLTAAAYDARPSATETPWSHFAAQVGSFTATFPRGRTVASAARSDGTWQLELTGYDAEERVVRRLVHTQDVAAAPALPAYDTELRFAYDRQGRLLTRETRLGSPGSWFRHWYDYGARGLVTRIFAGTSPSRPAVADVTYTYMDFGAPATVRLGSAPAIEHQYDARDRLVRIGGPVSTGGTPLHPFQAEYLYTPDGDVLQAAFYHRHAAGPETRDFWGYCYDDYDRLRFAARVEGGLPDPTQQCDEAWGITPDTPFSVADLTYDPNGNLRTLSRLDATGAAVDRLTYSYQPGTNRLASIADGGNGGSVAWDMEPGPVAYDANGNITQLPAPYIVTAGRFDHENRLLAATAGGRSLRNRYAVGGSRYMQRVGATLVEVDEMLPGPAHPAGAARVSPPRSPDAAGGRVVAEAREAESAAQGREPSPDARRFRPRFAPSDTSRPTRAARGDAGSSGDAVTFTALDAVGLRRGAAVRAPDGSVTFNLLTPAGEVIGRQPAAGGRLYDLRDALGSVRAVVDAAGGVVESRQYDAWGLALAGRTTGPASAREGFTGKERDAAAGGPLGGLDDFGARTYAPLLGRFLQADPAAADYPSWSPYTYTFNRPLSLIDPDGRRPTPMDWFRNDRGEVVWANSTSQTYELGGFVYHNIGSSILTFDGSLLTLHTQSRAENGRLSPEQFSIEAVSGLPVRGEFDYTASRQRVRDNGPIPEGLWQTGPGFMYEAQARVLPVGYRGPDGTAFFVDLTAVTAPTYERSGFEIHPDGNQRGTAGCIGLDTADMRRVREFYQRLRQQMRAAPGGKTPMLMVKYDQDQRP